MAVLRQDLVSRVYCPFQDKTWPVEYDGRSKTKLGQ